MQDSELALHRFDCLDAMERHWDALASRAAAGPLASFDWWRCVAASDGAAAPLMIGASLGGEPAAAAILRRRRLGPVSVLEPIGGTPLSARAMLGSPELAGRPGVEELLRGMALAAGGCDLVILPAQPAETGGRPNPWLRLRNRAEPAGIALTSLSTPWGRCDARHRGPRTRRKELRRERRLAERGHVRFRVAGTPAERASFVRELLRQKACRSHVAGRNVEAERACGRLLTAASQLDGSHGGPAAWLTGLECGGRLLAVAIGLVDARAYAGLRLTVTGDPDVAAFARGLLVSRTLRLAAERGLATATLPPLAAGPHDPWTDEWRELRQATLSLTPLGRIAEEMLHGGAAGLVGLAAAASRQALGRSLARLAAAQPLPATPP